VGPKPRRFTYAAPAAEPAGTVFAVEPPLVAETNCGCSLSISSTVIAPESLISSAPMTAIGVDASDTSRAMREPVTTMTSPSSGVCVDGGWVWSCPCATPLAANITEARRSSLVRATRARPGQNLAFMIPPSYF
jgi:hypothetical protein